MSQASALFKLCVQAVARGELIQREGRNDKEFHFQNWFSRRLIELGVHFDQPGRNTYPDFRLVEHTEGYEVKGLAYPGREADYDCNSQVPSGEHNGRTVYYAFGRYPATPDGDAYPVLDFVLCHGAFLNADNAYVHENKSFRGFGSYGDILVRDRKMYVAPTPFALVEGTAHRLTLIVPADEPVDDDLVHVGLLMRTEVNQVVATYGFDLRTRELHTKMVPNPGAGNVHVFAAYRMLGGPDESVTMRERAKVLARLKAPGKDDDE